LLYYGYRYYQPSTGRWLSRDPIGEVGGVNIYSSMLNNSVIHYDPVGLNGADVTKTAPITLSWYEATPFTVDIVNTPGIKSRTTINATVSVSQTGRIQLALSIPNNTLASHREVKADEFCRLSV
jgi:uncharacterized protein RhaS with RHS repeats